VDDAGARGQRRLLDAVLSVGSDLDLPAMLDRVVSAAVDLVDARYGALGVLDETGTRLAQFITVGIDEAGRRRIGTLPEGHGILGLLILDAQPLRLPDLREHPDSYGFPENHPPMKSFLGVPIRLRDNVFGNLYLTDKTTGDVFTDVDEELVIGLASAAAVAIENARLHARLSELVLVDDRERIARDLHDTVIQRLFATGLSLQATTRLIRSNPDAAVERVDAAVDELDTTVKHIRSAIFGLESTRTMEDGLRSRVMALTRDAARGLGFEPHVLFDGPVDSRVPSSMAAEVVAVLREALSNIGRHAHAKRADVELVVGTDVLLRITDDGVGPIDVDDSGKGLPNMRTRAEKLRGSFTMAGGASGGAVVEWRVPLPQM
jgi:signal transduction histidine kinase